MQPGSYVVEQRVPVVAVVVGENVVAGHPVLDAPVLIIAALVRFQLHVHFGRGEVTLVIAPKVGQRVQYGCLQVVVRGKTNRLNV